VSISISVTIASRVRIMMKSRPSSVVQARTKLGFKRGLRTADGHWML
jgi:hypothetical protein